MASVKTLCVNGIDLSDSVTAAQALLGCTLTYDSPAGLVSGRIVETEAYDASDPASHSYRGRTARNAPMFEAAGTVYIYFTYGMHYCTNVVSGEAGQGQGVLLRALEPLEGLDIMRHNRGQEDVHALCSGPAKLVQALGIPPSLSGSRYDAGPLRLRPRTPGYMPEIVNTTRIGLREQIPVVARYYINGNPFISRP